jgi:hypothetical protein
MAETVEKTEYAGISLELNGQPLDLGRKSLVPQEEWVLVKNEATSYPKEDPILEATLTLEAIHRKKFKSEGEGNVTSLIRRSFDNHPGLASGSLAGAAAFGSVVGLAAIDHINSDVAQAVSSIPGCQDFPAYFQPVFNYLPKPDCLIYNPQSPLTYPDTNLNAVVIGSDIINASQAGQAHAMLNETCKLYQYQFAKQQGFIDMLDYFRTAPGIDFNNKTGWQINYNAPIEPAITAPQSFESGWGPFPNPVEDNAQTCAYGINGKVYLVTTKPQNYLQQFPIRNSWYNSWIGNGVITPTRTPTVTFSPTALPDFTPTPSATASKSPTASPTATNGAVQALAGKNFTVIEQPGARTVLRWENITSQAQIFRLTDIKSTLDVFPVPSGMLQYVDTLPANATVGAYALLNLPSGPLSHIIYVFPKYDNGLIPEGVAAMINQSGQAEFTYPTDADELLLLPIGRDLVRVPGTNSKITYDLASAGCFLTGNIRNGQVGLGSGYCLSPVLGAP